MTGMGMLQSLLEPHGGLIVKQTMRGCIQERLLSIQALETGLCKQQRDCPGAAVGFQESGGQISPSAKLCGSAWSPRYSYLNSRIMESLSNSSWRAPNTANTLRTQRSVWDATPNLSLLSLQSRICGAAAWAGGRSLSRGCRGHSDTKGSERKAFACALTARLKVRA